MSKTIEELNKIKEEVETMNKKLQELTEEELKQVVGGYTIGPDVSGVIRTTVINHTIDPADIESMETLKDATSTGIYGSRGK